MNPKNILITGSNGQLGSEFKDLAKNNLDCNFIFVDKEELDITDKLQVLAYFDNQRIDYCINAAAYTAVDNAETDKENAFKVNSIAVAYLAEACAIHKVKLIQISTDFVFDGKQNVAYKETDITSPLSIYGDSKLDGEKHALDNDFLVIRTSWLYSSYGSNFVKTMIRLGSERSELNIINDQIGTPTYAKDLAEAIIFIVLNNKKDRIKGLYHFSNSGVASWCDFAKEIFSIRDIDCVVNPIPTKEYPTPAERPKFSLMDKSKIQNEFSISLIDWKISLNKCLKKIYKNDQ